MALTKHVDDLRPPVSLEVESRLAKLVRGTNVNNFTKRQQVLLRSTSVLFDSPESLESGMSMAGDDQLVVLVFAGPAANYRSHASDYDLRQDCRVRHWRPRRRHPHEV
ncbi:hypothetical protein E4U23_006374 [Claviceps purpurea]|nr:hypothetical protein E4U23_006374 [Claviceps purpurea]